MTTNLIPYPEAFDNATWVKARCSATANVEAAPHGFMVADKLQETTEYGAHFIYNKLPILAAGTVCNFSVYAKAAERSAIRLVLAPTGFTATCLANFDLASGRIASSIGAVNPTITSLSGGWYRCAIASTAIAASTGLAICYSMERVDGSFVYTGVAGNGVYLWGGKAELGESANPYQPITPYLGWLDTTAPEEGANLYLGDGEIRDLKTAIKGSFPLIDAPVSASAAEWNTVIGLESDWATDLAAKADTTHTHDGEAIGVVTLGDDSRATTQASGDDGTKVATTAFTKGAIASAGLGSAWTTAAILTAASSTSLAFTPVASCDHYRILSRDLTVHSTGTLRSLFGTRDSLITSGYSWGVSASGITATAISDSSDSSMKLDGGANVGPGAAALDARLFWSDGSPKRLTWRISGFRSGAPVVYVGGGCINSATVTRMLIGFVSAASFTGSLVVLGRKT